MCKLHVEWPKTHMHATCSNLILLLLYHLIVAHIQYYWLQAYQLIILRKIWYHYALLIDKFLNLIRGDKQQSLWCDWTIILLDKQYLFNHSNYNNNNEFNMK